MAAFQKVSCRAISGMSDYRLLGYVRSLPKLDNCEPLPKALDLGDRLISGQLSIQHSLNDFAIRLPTNDQEGPKSCMHWGPDL